MKSVFFFFMGDLWQEFPSYMFFLLAISNGGWDFETEAGG